MCPAAIIVLCGVATTIEGTQKNKILVYRGKKKEKAKNKQDVLSWARAINCEKFKVTMSAKVLSLHRAIAR